MVTITVTPEIATFQIEGWDKLWSLTSRLNIPLVHIWAAQVKTEIARHWWKGFRIPGTHVPGVITAGTFYQDSKRVFWDV